MSHRPNRATRLSVTAHAGERYEGARRRPFGSSSGQALTVPQSTGPAFNPGHQALQ